MEQQTWVLEMPRSEKLLNIFPFPVKLYIVTYFSATFPLSSILS